MVDRAHALWTGIFVLVLGGALVLLALWLTERGERRPYLVVSQHPVSGLTPNSAVSYRGVPVGEVRTIEISPHDPRKILIRIGVKPDVPVTRSTFAFIRRLLVTGISQLQLDSDWTDPQPLPTSAREPARIPLRPSLTDRLTELGPEVVERATRVVSRLEAMLSESNLRRVEQILDNTAAATGELRGLERRLDVALRTVPAVGRDAQRALRGIEGLATQLQELPAVIEKLASSATELAHGGQQASRELVQKTLPRIDRAFAQLADTARSIERLARVLREDPQAVVRGRRRLPPGPGEAGYEADER